MFLLLMNGLYVDIYDEGAVVALANGIGPIIGAALASQSQNSWFLISCH